MKEGPTKLNLRDLGVEVTGPSAEISEVDLDPERPLVWRRAMLASSEFELKQGPKMVGEIEPATVEGVAATGLCLGHSLEMSLESSLRSGIRVRSQVSLKAEGGPEFSGRFYGWGEVRTIAGETLRWRHGVWRIYDHALFDSAGEQLLRLRPAFLRFIGVETLVMVSDKGWAREDLGQLMLLTWFLRLQANPRLARAFRSPQ